MGSPKVIHLHEVRKEDVAICPECGVGKEEFEKES